MRRIIFALLSLSVFSSASLLYLDRRTETQTAFESPGTTWSATDDDDISVSIGFSFPFNGNNYSDVTINSNGTLSFISNSHTYNNTELSNSASDDYNIFPYWEDLNPPQGGTIKYGLVGAGASAHFVVWWDGVARYGSSGSLSFQVVLYQDGNIRFRYLEGSNADGTYVGNDPGSDQDGGTVGVKEDSTHYDQYIFDAALDQTLDVVYFPTPPPSSDDYTDWHFDELEWTGASNEAKDSHWDKHGEGHNAPSVPGKICQAMDLTASSNTDYAEFDNTAIDGLGDFTASIWVKSDHSHTASIITGEHGSTDVFQLWVHGDKLQLWLNGSTRPDTSLPANFFNNQWHHVVWRRQSGQLCVFFDGTKECPSHTLDTNAIESDVFFVGQETDDGSTFNASQDWEGLVDELMIFRKALTDSEIQTGYNNQNAGNNWDGSARTCPYPSIAKTSCVISDPVNGATHPKRIPGATIRYAIELDNPNTATTSNNIIEDTLDSNFDTTTIRNLQIQNGTCNCTGVASASNNGANGTANGVNPVKLDYGTVNGNSKECGYFEVDIK